MTYLPLDTETPQLWILSITENIQSLEGLTSTLTSSLNNIDPYTVLSHTLMMLNTIYVFKGSMARKSELSVVNDTLNNSMIHLIGIQDNSWQGPSTDMFNVRYMIYTDVFCD